MKPSGCRLYLRIEAYAGRTAAPARGRGVMPQAGQIRLKGCQSRFESCLMRVRYVAQGVGLPHERATKGPTPLSQTGLQSAVTCAHFSGPSPAERQTQMQNLPDKFPLATTAFFFDFDGTLVELAPTPDGVTVQPVVPAILGALRRATNGAVAIVSGRGIESIDSFLSMPDLPVAGLHGAERRDSNADVHRVGFNDERLLRMEHVLEGVVKANPGTLLEIKGAALALHYRNAPERGMAAREATEKLVAQYADAYVLQPGKMVYEIKPKDVDKGRAVVAFLNEPPFASCRSGRVVSVMTRSEAIA